MITRYGMEGTPVYFVGEPGTLRIDLKPDNTVEQILKKCQAGQENLSPIRRAKKQLGLAPAAMALLFHYAPKAGLEDMRSLATVIKDLPIAFKKPRPLAEAISSAGGLALGELADQLMLKKFPGVFAAGEMLDWDAPTGGFLIQACVSQGHLAGQGIVRFLRENQDLPRP